MTNLEYFTLFFVCIVLFVCIIYYFIPNSWQLKCIISNVDGNTYCVRDRTKLQESADLLARVVTKCEKLIHYLKENYSDDDRVKRLAENFNPRAIYETLPNSQYTAFSVNKGEQLQFCLNNKKNDEQSGLIDENTLFFVALHENAHLANLSIGHKSDFWDCFKWLLEKAKEGGFYEPVDYKKKPTEYCSMTIKDNPYYDV
jgi:hypothetical protein